MTQGAVVSKLSGICTATATFFLPLPSSRMPRYSRPGIIPGLVALATPLMSTFGP